MGVEGWHSQRSDRAAHNFCWQDHLCGKEPGLTDELASVLSELTQLSKTENSKVALKARQVGKVIHLLRVWTPYNVRHVCKPVPMQSKAKVGNRGKGRQ